MLPQKSEIGWLRRTRRTRTMSTAALLPTLLPLSKEEKKVVDKRRPCHIVTAFFEVSEQPQQKKADLYKSILDAFTSRVDKDSDLSSVCKTHILLGNENKAFNGERLWDKAKEVKSRFVNDY
jgi:hypothetical protein